MLASFRVIVTPETSSLTLSTLLKLLNIISSTDLIDVLERGIQEPILDKALLTSPIIGIGGLLKAFRDEDFQRGLGLVVREEKERR
jgi:uncharacterized protein YjgD (DUF1641 family)